MARGDTGNRCGEYKQMASSSSVTVTVQVAATNDLVAGA